MRTLTRVRPCKLNKTPITKFQLMRVYAGTSGFSYKEWKGSFYPEKLPNSQMLSFYAERLSAVEINNTFYRMPRQEALDKWRADVPDDFRFVLKASRRITHFKRLKETDEITDHMFSLATSLGPKLGVMLFQLPPNFPKDIERLATFLELVPEGVRITFEFRHPSWRDSEVSALLAENNVALCMADTDDDAGEIERTADWGYIRLRRSTYSEEQLQDWSRRLKDQQWKDVFVFFKHEDDATGPAMASKLVQLSLK